MTVSLRDMRRCCRERGMGRCLAARKGINISTVRKALFGRY